MDEIVRQEMLLAESTYVPDLQESLKRIIGAKAAKHEQLQQSQRLSEEAVQKEKDVTLQLTALLEQFQKLKVLFYLTAKQVSFEGGEARVRISDHEYGSVDDSNIELFRDRDIVDPASIYTLRERNGTERVLDPRLVPDPGGSDDEHQIRGPAE